jgi:hypothetical protein
MLVIALRESESLVLPQKLVWSGLNRLVQHLSAG